MRLKDVASGAVLLAIAGAYHLATRRIARSSLSDEVGADGLPHLLTAALVLLGGAIALRGLLARPVAAAPAVGDGGDAAQQAGLPRALGFLAIGVGYMLVAPLVGYAVGVALLIVAVALYEGLAPSWRLAAVACAGGVAFWLIFVALLGVTQPASPFWAGRFGG